MGWNPYQNDHEDANGQFEMYEFWSITQTAISTRYGNEQLQQIGIQMI